MPKPDLFTLPLELRQMIWNFAIDSEEITICTSRRESWWKQGCLNHKHLTPFANPNMNLLLVNKKLYSEILPLIPFSVDVVFSRLACADRYLNHRFPALGWHVHKITFTEYTRHGMFGFFRLLRMKYLVQLDAKAAFPWARWVKAMWSRVRKENKMRFVTEAWI
jgi:hypothetical protein